MANVLPFKGTSQIRIPLALEGVRQVRLFQDPSSCVNNKGSYSKITYVVTAEGFEAVSKELKDEPTEEARAALDNEIDIVKDLHHRNVVNVIDYSLKDPARRTFLALERGTPVATEARRLAGMCHTPSWEPPMDPETKRRRLQELLLFVLRVVCDVAAGVDYMHRLGYILVDLHPENIIKVDGVSKLIDFGLVHRMAHAADLVTDKKRGAESYRSPELMAGKGAGQPADVFALGASAFYLLWCKTVEHGGIMTCVRDDGDFSHLEKQLEGRVHPAMICLLKEAMAMDPAERPTADQLRERAKQLLKTLFDVTIDDSVEAHEAPGRPRSLGSELPPRLLPALAAAPEAPAASGLPEEPSAASTGTGPSAALVPGASGAAQVYSLAWNAGLEQPEQQVPGPTGEQQQQKQHTDQGGSARRSALAVAPPNQERHLSQPQQKPAEATAPSPAEATPLPPGPLDSLLQDAQPYDKPSPLVAPASGGSVEASSAPRPREHAPVPFRSGVGSHLNPAALDGEPIPAVLGAADNSQPAPAAGPQQLEAVRYLLECGLSLQEAEPNRLSTQPPSTSNGSGSTSGRVGRPAFPPAGDQDPSQGAEPSFLREVSNEAAGIVEGSATFVEPESAAQQGPGDSGGSRPGAPESSSQLQPPGTTMPPQQTPSLSQGPATITGVSQRQQGQQGQPAQGSAASPPTVPHDRPHQHQDPAGKRIMMSPPQRPTPPAVSVSSSGSPPPAPQQRVTANEQEAIAGFSRDASEAVERTSKFMTQTLATALAETLFQNTGERLSIIQRDSIAAMQRRAVADHPPAPKPGLVECTPVVDPKKIREFMETCGNIAAEFRLYYIEAEVYHGKPRVIAVGIKSFAKVFRKEIPSGPLILYTTGSRVFVRANRGADLPTTQALETHLNKCR